MYIVDAAGLEQVCGRLKGQARIALDTEFVGEGTFTPTLELVQVAAGDVCAAIDVQAVGSLDCLADVLHDPGIEKVLHAGRQDLELFLAHTGKIPAPVFDTQVAAAMVGYGTQVAYASLVQRIVGARIDKSHTLSNWSQRPLSREQVAYALEDVQFLLQVHAHLQQRLEQLGRQEWIEEEFQRLAAKVGEGVQDPGERYQRIRGWENLKPRAVAVLRELVRWREAEAKRRNVPRGRVVRDEILLELARRTPSTVAQLRATRGLHAGEIERNGETLLATIRAGVALPEDAWPQAPRVVKPDLEPNGLVDLLQAVLKAKAAEHEIAPGLLATADDLQLLAAGEASEELPILCGWRRKLAGEALIEALAGRVAVAVEPRKRRLTFLPTR